MVAKVKGRGHEVRWLRPQLKKAHNWNVISGNAEGGWNDSPEGYQSAGKPETKGIYAPSDSSARMRIRTAWAFWPSMVRAS